MNSGSKFLGAGGGITTTSGLSPSDPSFVVLSTNTGLSNERVLTGTSNQVVVTDNGANNTVVLSLPQNIHSGASPSFTGLTLSGLTAGRVVITGSGGVLSTDAGITYDATNDQLALPTTGSGAGLLVGGDVQWYRGAADRWQTPDSVRIDGTVGVGVAPISTALINLTSTVTLASSNEYAIFGQVTGNPSADTANRVFGMSFTAIGATNFNYTDTTGGLTGLQMAIQHTGSGTITVGNGAIISGISSSTGTFTTLHMLYGLGYDVSSGATIGVFHGIRSDLPRASGGGTVNEADSFFASPRTVSGGTITLQGFYNSSSSGLNAYTANSQTRFGLRLPTMPSVGAFTGTTTASIWIGYNGTPTGATDGIAFGSGLDVIIYRSGSAALSITGSITGSSAITAGTTVTAPTSVLSPLFASNSAANAVVVRGFDSVLSSAATGITLRGGDAAASGGTGGSVSIRGGIAGPMGGVAGSINLYKSDGTTLVEQINNTGIGWFATTPAAQQTSGANLTNNVTAGGTNDTIADITDLVIYANDAANIRNDIYQLARKLKQINDGLRTFGLFT